MTSTRLAGAIILCSLAPGLFMTFDGIRALTVGDYVTPRSGPYAGQLGPWHHLVSAIGISPRSTTMKIAFVVFGLLWLASVAAFALRVPGGRSMLAVMSVATLWYLPVGTIVSVLVLMLLALSRSAG